MSHAKRKGKDEHLPLHSSLEALCRGQRDEEPLPTRDNNSHGLHTDIYETPREIIITVDMPGIPKENADLFIAGNRIIVEAAKKDKNAPRNAKYYCIERLFGKLRREIEIPCTIHTSKIEAEMKNGVLTVILPKIDDRRGTKKRIEIK